MPVTPGGTGASFDVLLAFSMDEAANQRVQQRITTVEEELKRIQKEAGGVGTEYKKSSEEIQDESKKIAQDLKAQAKLMRAEASSLASDVKAANISLLRELSGAIQDLSTKALITGGAIVGGIFAEVQNYVNTVPQATAGTKAWEAATQSLGRSRQRIDQELLTTALPLLQQAAKVANQAAGIVERHPEITSLALKAGAILVGVGVIGTAVSKGIKLVADATYLTTIPTQLTAARIMDTASDKMFAAAELMVKGNITSGTGGGGGGAGKLLGNIGLIGGFLTLSASAIVGTGKALDFVANELSQLGPLGKTAAGGISAAKGGIFPLIKNLFGLRDAAKKTGEDISQATGKIKGSANEKAIVEAFSSWKEDDARIVREAAENRKKIIQDAEREIANITRDYNNQRVDINRQFNDRGAEIRQRFAESNTEAEQNYQQSRAQIIQDSAQRLQELEESHLERLRQIRKDAQEGIEEASRSRDALGLVQAQRQAVEAEAEENRSFRLEAARARRETEQRLGELDQQYAAERARRQAQFEQDLRDNEAQRAEELSRAAEAYQQEIQQQREAERQKLAELQEGLNEERIRRREVFNDQLNDLGIFFEGERAIRQNAYNNILTEAQAFFDKYGVILTGAGKTSPFSGVTGTVGTSSTQDALYSTVASAVSGAVSGVINSGGNQTVVYNDGRRMEYQMSKAAKSDYEQTAVKALKKALGAG